MKANYILHLLLILIIVGCPIMLATNARAEDTPETVYVSDDPNEPGGDYAE